MNCQTFNPTEDKNYHYDFYFGKDYLQILGKGTMPSSEDLPYIKKLEQCVQDAKMYSDSKWLGITEKYIELQTLWYDRLKSNYYSHWKICLNNAKIVKIIPIYPGTCRIVVHYFCNPMDW
ncbi:MAG: hypothetical protein ACK4UJ_04220 [Leptonema sp. (in: bacteria)]